jgi:hypothetical protein
LVSGVAAACVLVAEGGLGGCRSCVQYVSQLLDRAPVEAVIGRAPDNTDLDKRKTFQKMDSAL